MLLLLEKVKQGVTPKQIIQPIVSLGMPTEIFKGSQNIWALKMASEEDTMDAVFVLNKNIAFIQRFLGDKVSISTVARLPEHISFVVKNIVGRGEA